MDRSDLIHYSIRMQRQSNKNTSNEITVKSEFKIGHKMKKVSKKYRFKLSLFQQYFETCDKSEYLCKPLVNE